MNRQNSALRASLAMALFAAVFLLFFVLLPEVFNGERELNPIAVSYGGLSVRWYGILIALGALVAYLLIESESKREKVESNQLESVVLLVLLFGLLGARLGFVIQNVTYFAHLPLEILKFYHGGLSIHGALIGGLVALYISTRKTKLSFYKIANIISPPVLLAIAIGRWGNFFNQEIIGKPAQIPWKMYVAVLNRPVGLENVEFFHPVFLYESLALVLIFSLFWLFLRDKNIGLIYTLCGYCAVRIVVEFWRVDYKPIFLKFDLAQIVSFAIILLVLITYYFGRKYAKSKSRAVRNPISRI